MRNSVFGGAVSSLVLLYPAIVCVHREQWLGASGWLCAAVCMAAGHLLLWASRAESELARKVVANIEELRRLNADAEVALVIKPRQADGEERREFRS